MRLIHSYPLKLEWPEEGLHRKLENFLASDKPRLFFLTTKFLIARIIKLCGRLWRDDRAFDWSRWTNILLVCFRYGPVAYVQEWRENATIIPAMAPLRMACLAEGRVLLEARYLKS